MAKCFRTLLAFSLISALSACWALGQPERVAFELLSQSQQVKPGEGFEAILKAKVDEGWHLYSMSQPEGGPIPTTIRVDEQGAFRLAGDIVQPPVRVVYDPNFDMDTEYIEGDVEFLIPVEVRSQAVSGQHELKASIRFMMCSEKSCLPPRTKSFSTTIQVVPRSVPGGTPSAALLAAPVQQDRLPLLDSVKKVEFALIVENSRLSAGEAGQAALNVQLAPGWHLYSLTQKKGGPIPTQISLVDNPVFELNGSIEQPEITKEHDPNFDMEVEYIKGGDFALPFRVAGDAPGGRHELALKIRFMMCDDQRCLPPQTQTISTVVEVSGGGAGPGSEAASARPESAPQGQAESIGSAAPALGRAESSQAAGEQGNPGGAAAQVVEEEREVPASILGYLGFAMLMGGLALLTPCVFPMIPITVSYFTKREAATRKQAVKDAGIYAIGIIATFTLLAFALTLLMGAGGINRIAASPMVNLAIAAIFILFALSLFGVLEIRLPTRWVNAIDRKGTATGGAIGIMLMALTFSLTSFTCTVPFVGTVMVAALQGDWLWSLLGIFGYSLAFASPFFLLAIFPSWLQSLPKSGNWMNSVKIVMGFLEIAAAIKFLSNIDLVFQWEILTRPVFITIWLAISLITVAYLLGWFRFNHEMPSETLGAFRVLSAVFFLAISLYLMRGMFGYSLGEVDAFLPPRDYGRVEQAALFNGPGGGSPHEELDWHSDYDKALLAARRENRPIFIDFTGYTCTNCRWMEANMFPRPEIDELLRQFVLVRLYTDGGEPEHAANMEFEQERFGTIALPLYAIMGPNDEILGVSEGLTREASKFEGFLRKGLNRFGNEQLVAR